MQKLPTDFPGRLQWLRERKQVSRIVLGELCGLGKNQIARYERGEQEPTATVLSELADYFGVSIDFLLGREL